MVEGATPRITLREIFGLTPLIPALQDGWHSIAGNPYDPPSRWGLSSLRIFKPTIGLPAWLGRRRPDRRVPIYNFFNRSPHPLDEGYSVRVTHARDVQGGHFTYDGHLGTDFAVPVGTTVVAGAPGRVLRVRNDLGHGGLKVCIDHGGGLFTTSSHLSRALVRVGQTVRRGEPVGLSGASGVELILFFPWVAPHLHYNVWLDGQPVDPFAAPGTGEVPIWRGGDPRPWDGVAVPEDEAFRPSEWDAEGVEASIQACRDPAIRERARALPSLELQAAEMLIMRNFRSACFERFPRMYRERGERRSCLDLPFRREDFVGVAMPGE